ncbi:hypothetical protein ABVN18_19465 [Pseudomonas canadensis]|uniref:hypothetical protein n=1 Tax=Pseudomonas canadensis TaxID=915099 RepID=UPI0010C09EA7|nr:hypothetical protein PflCFBP13510_19355 [Pseudomonas fluorescens]
MWTPSPDCSARLFADYVAQKEAGKVPLVNHYSAQTRKRAKFLGYPRAEPAPYQRDGEQKT